MNEVFKKETIYVDVLPAYSERSLSTIIKDVCSNRLPIFQVSKGHYMKNWFHARVGSKVIYCIDGTGVCSGDIIFIKQKSFKPLWTGYHDVYKSFVDFARSFCEESFDKDWHKEMIDKHIEAIEKRKWLFVVFAVIEPNLHYINNIRFFRDRVKTIEKEEREMELFVNGP